MQTIGERLEDARKRKGLSIREAAEATKIRGDYLQKFEGNQFNIGLTDIYIKGFLRNYATFLQVPADRIVNDYLALGHAEPRARPPSREVYGRMEVSISGAGGVAPAAADHGARGDETPAAGAGGETARPTLRPHASGLPTTRLDPALVFKILIGGAGVIMLLLIVWLLKSLFGGSSRPAAAEHPSPIVSAPAAAFPAESDATVTLVATQPVSLRVTGTDGREIWTGQLAAGDRHDFPNTGFRVSASAIEAIEVEFRGRLVAKFGGHGAHFSDVPVMH